VNVQHHTPTALHPGQSPGFHSTGG